uniref:Uncharacterized protein n=1 Tax=Oryza rufipogon TaxID=4529 RepID=A0A0E0NZT5_ORYRU
MKISLFRIPELRAGPCWPSLPRHSTAIGPGQHGYNPTPESNRVVPGTGQITGPWVRPSGLGPYGHLYLKVLFFVIFIYSLHTLVVPHPLGYGRALNPVQVSLLSILQSASLFCIW